MEIKYLTAKTVEEAMMKASAEYGNETDVSYEIVEMPKKGFLGIGSTPAKIKVTYETSDTSTELSNIVSELKNLKLTTDRNYGDYSEPKKQPKPEQQPGKQAVKQPKPQAKQENQPKPEKREQPKQPRHEQPQPKANKPQAQKPEKQDAPKFEAKPKTDVVVTPEEMQIGIAFAKKLLENMHIDAEVTQSGDSKIQITGDTTSILIGHHGETLDAIQYLVNLCVCRSSGTSQKEFVKIAVDVENYREKREETLRALARRMSAKAIKYKRNVLLEPMNPYERRIIHSEVQGIENVSTHSVGSDENRKIVITYEGPDKADRRRRPPRRTGNPAEREVSSPTEAAEETAQSED